MSNSRRFRVAVLVVGALVSPWLAAPAAAQQGHTNPITLPTESKSQGIMRGAQDLINDQNWPEAVKALQALLNQAEDGFIQVSRDVPGQKSVTLWVSIRSEATRLLSTLPKDGLTVYEQQYGREAAAQLAQGRANNDPQVLAQVAQRYLHTKAGAEATELLATRALEREEFMMASLYFERLLNRPHPEPLSTQPLFKAALAFARAGDKANSEKAWEMLTQRSKREGGVSLGGQLVSLDRVKEELEKGAKDVSKGLAYDWPVYRGTLNRTGRGVAGLPGADPDWKLSTLPMRGDAKSWVEEQLTDAARTAEGQQMPFLPQHHPVAVGGKLLFHYHDGVYAFDLRTRHEKKAEDVRYWWSPTDGGAFQIIGDPNRKQLLDQWKAMYSQQGPKSVLIENSLTGSLSTDGNRIFTVDDLIFPIHPQMMFNFRFGGEPNFGALNDNVSRNSLKAYNLESGKLMWDLGNPKSDTSILEKSFFLGPPLPLGGRIYLLNEKDGALRLVCMECKDTNFTQPAPTIHWTQTLANTKDKFATDFGRRLHAAHLSYGEGILVCPTNAGAVLGVDLLTHSLVWAFSYREPEAQPQPVRPGRMPQQFAMPNLANEWRNTAPAIADGKVVFTAPDGAALQCLNLRDGRPVWKQSRAADDLYLAGIFNGKAVVVSKNRVRQFRLSDGKEEGTIENTGLPSGEGVAGDGYYYLPVKSGAESREPEIVVIDIAKAKVQARIKSEKKELPGNLIFHDGLLISQTATGIATYPLKKEGDETPAKEP